MNSADTPGRSRVLRRLQNNWQYAALLLLVAPAIAWLQADRGVWPWDPSWYGEVSADLWYNLTHSLRGWAASMLLELNMKPPGIVWLGQFFVPLRHLTGSVERALLLSIILTQFCLLSVIYRIGRILRPGSRLIPLLGAAFAAGAQAFVGLSHAYFVEPLQAAAVAWVALAAFEAPERPPARTAIHFAGALLLGALAKATTPVYCFVFCLYAFWAVARKGFHFDWRAEWRSVSSRWLILAMALVGPATAAWYGFNLSAVWRHVQEASSGEIALNYGFRASVGRKLITWIGLWKQSFLAPYLGWLLATGLLIAAGYTLARRKQKWLRLWTCAGLAFLQLFAVLLLFSLNDAVDARYLYPAIVFTAVLFMAIWAAIPSRILQAVALAACAVQWTAVNSSALGVAAPLEDTFEWVAPPHREASHYDALTRVILLTSIEPGRYNIVGVEEPWLNSNSAAFFAAKQRLDTGIRSYYTSLGYAEKDTATALARIEALRTRYFITVDAPFHRDPPNFVNIVSLPVFERVRADGRFRRVPFSGHTGIVIFERMEPGPSK